MPPPRILHCLRSPVGGLFRHVRDLAAEQTRRGFDVGVLCDDLAKDSLTERRLAELDAQISLGVHRTSMARGLALSDISAFRATRDLLQALQINVAHGHGAKGGAHARLAGRALKSNGQRLATIYTPHGGSLNYGHNTAAGRVFLALERQLIAATDGIVFESAFARRTYLNHVGGRAVHHKVIFNGLLDQEFATPQLSDTATDLLFIGELRQVKGVDVLIKALAEMRTTRAATLTVVGEGPESDNLKSLATSLGLAQSIRFVGAKPAREAFTLGRCMVVPSRKESFPYVVLEAAAASIPLIATDVGGISEIVEGSDTGLILSDDITGLASALLDVLTRPDAAHARAAHLRELVRQRFTVKNMTNDICAFYADSAVALAA